MAEGDGSKSNGKKKDDKRSSSGVMPYAQLGTHPYTSEEPHGERFRGNSDSS